MCGEFRSLFGRKRLVLLKIMSMFQNASKLLLSSVVVSASWCLVEDAYIRCRAPLFAKQKLMLGSEFRWAIIFLNSFSQT